MAYLIGIDVGTSGTKSILVREDGEVVARATEEYPLLTPRPGWTEQNPEDWWEATQKTVAACLQQAGVSGDEIAGVGFSGQMHGSVFLDEKGEVVRPCILWNDGRTAKECDEITEILGDKLQTVACNPALTGFTAPKVVWLKNQEPENFKKTATLLLPKDYVRYRLSGELAAEVADGAGSLLFDVPNRTWSKDIFDALGIPWSWAPPIHESTAICGHLSDTAARVTGLKAGTPLVGGGADNPCGAIGTGVVKPGRVLASLGTSGVIFAPSDEVQVDPDGRLHTFCHSVPGQWYLMGVILSAGLSFRWFRDIIGTDDVRAAETAGADPYDLLTQLAAEAPIGSEGLLFMPYLTGERTPHRDPFARGGFVGLTIRHERRHLVRALLEGITFAMRDSLELAKALNVPIDEIRATGGGGKSPFWRQLQADIYGHEICTVNTDEGPALGGALMAGVGVGVYGSLVEACDQIVKVAERVEPNAERHEQYNEVYEIFNGLYGDVKERCHRLHAFAEKTHSRC